MRRNVAVTLYKEEIPCVILVESETEALGYIFEVENLPPVTSEGWNRKVCEAYRLIVMAAYRRGVELPVIDPKTGNVVDLDNLVYPPFFLEDK